MHVVSFEVCFVVFLRTLEASASVCAFYRLVYLISNLEIKRDLEILEIQLAWDKSTKD